MNLLDNGLLVATTLQNFEDILANEIIELGAEIVEKGNRAVTYKGDYDIIYKSNLWLRTAVRVLKPLHNATVKNEKDLFKAIYKLDWGSFIKPHQTFMIVSSISSDYFSNSLYASLKAKDAIVDKIRKQTEERPNIDKQNPDFVFVLNIKGDEMRLSLDTSGGSLHKRGYREKVGSAPLSEVLAAGLIKLSGWDMETPFIDPMCGSGTLVTEAGLMAMNIAPGLFRKKFGFEAMPGFNKDEWKQVKQAAMRAIKTESNVSIKGFDLNKRAVEMSRENIENAGLEANVSALMKDFFKTNKEQAKGIIICNPPYNERLGLKDINGFYKLMGDTFKNGYKGYTAWVISGNIEAIKNVGLKTSRKIHVLNGKIPCKFHRFDMY